MALQSPPVALPLVIPENTEHTRAHSAAEQGCQEHNTLHTCNCCTRVWHKPYTVPPCNCLLVAAAGAHATAWECSSDIVILVPGGEMDIQHVRRNATAQQMHTIVHLYGGLTFQVCKNCDCACAGWQLLTRVCHKSVH